MSENAIDILLDALRLGLLAVSLVCAAIVLQIEQTRYRILFFLGTGLILWGATLDLTDSLDALNEVPVFGIRDPYHELIKDTLGYIPGLVLLGAGLVLHLRSVRRADQERIQQYERLLPICSTCGKIRLEAAEGEAEEWCSLQEFVQKKKDMDFTHTFCPSCAEEEFQKIEKRKALRKTKGL